MRHVLPALPATALDLLKLVLRQCLACCEIASIDLGIDLDV